MGGDYLGFEVEYDNAVPDGPLYNRLLIGSRTVLGLPEPDAIYLAEVGDASKPQARSRRKDQQ